ncbi:hypothetical protein WDW37_18250 [Bdellovibrionota bacterium FG-1]
MRLRGWLVLSFISLSAIALHADTLSYGGDSYQRDLMAKAMSGAGLIFEPHPEGKVIERIVVVPFDVILPEEPWPKFANWFHVTTVPAVIRRELLFREGDPWNQARADETARNLRNYLFLTSAAITPCQGTAPDRVIILVVTKDLWSLRPNLDFSFVGSRFERLDMELSEHNLAGHMKQGTIDLGMDLATWHLGQQYRDAHWVGSDWSLAEQGDLIWNRESGRMEGGVASLAFEHPLLTLDTPWASAGSIQYRRDIFRYFSGGEIASVSSAATGESLPYSLDRRLLELNFGFTRSLGRERKNNFSFGYRAFVHQFDLPAAVNPVRPQTIEEVASAILPRSENAGMLYAKYHYYWAEFHEFLDIDTFALSEDYRLGPDLSAELRYASRGFGFSSSFVEPMGVVSWTALKSDDLFSVAGTFDIRYQPEALTESAWVDGVAGLRVRNVTPKLGFFRFHSVVQATRRYNSLDREFNTLGSDSNLRGYPSGFFRGADMWAANFEARTIPLALSTLHFGLAGFFDVGDASDSWSTLGAHESTGLGLRVGLPQFNKVILRIDLGFPLESGPGISPTYVVAQWGQAF